MPSQTPHTPNPKPLRKPAFFCEAIVVYLFTQSKNNALFSVTRAIIPVNHDITRSLQEEKAGFCESE